MERSGVEIFLLLSKASQQLLRRTCFTENPALVKGVDEEDGRLRNSHEEVADGQVHDEEVGRRLQLLVTETHHD